MSVSLTSFRVGVNEGGGEGERNGFEDSRVEDVLLVLEALSTDLMAGGFFNESEMPFLRFRLGSAPADCGASVLAEVVAEVALIDRVDNGGLILGCEPCFLLWLRLWLGCEPEYFWKDFLARGGCCERVTLRWRMVFGVEGSKSSSSSSSSTSRRMTCAPITESEGMCFEIE